MKSYKIHLIRHGRTQANEEGLYVGRTDLPLSPGGLNALLALREGGGYPTAGRFFTSPLTRCRQTLEVLYPGCRQEVGEGLAECDFGRWEGRSAASLQLSLIHILKSEPLRFGLQWCFSLKPCVHGGIGFLL